MSGYSVKKVNRNYWVEGGLEPDRMILTLTQVGKSSEFEESRLNFSETNYSYDW